MTDPEIQKSDPQQQEAAEVDTPGNSIATRKVDATAMKAFAHPLRMAMYDYLNDHGSATATMLATHLGESTGQTSYHLRQLERHGFVTDDLTRGKGRERWWKALGFTMQGLDLAKDRSTRPAVVSTLQHQVNQRAENLRSWYLRSEDEAEDWIQTSVSSRYSLRLTVGEATEMRDRVLAAMQPYADLSKSRTEEAAADADGLRRVRVYVDVFPLDGE